MKTKILILVKKWTHHTKHSAFGMLFETLKSDKIEFFILYEDDLLGFLRKPIRLIIKSILKKNKWFIFLEDFYLTRFIKKNKIEFIHFTSLEDFYHELEFKIPKIKSVHIPNSQFILYPYFRDRIKNTDTLLVVSESQKEYLQDYSNKISFIPLPIDTNYFTPNYDHKDKYSTKTFNCITCGAHLRDYVTLYNIIKEIIKLNFSINFIIVYPTKALHSKPYLLDIFNDLSEYQNVRFFTGISDDKLKELYNDSHLLILPMYDATANCTVLESLSMGIPVITTKLKGTIDYLNESSSFRIEKNNIESYINTIIDLYNNRDECIKMSKAAREFCVANFDTSIVSQMYLNFYHGLLK